MNSKERYDYYKKSGLFKETKDAVIIEGLVKILIESLYKPVLSDLITQVDQIRIKEYDIDYSEPINWGDLKCNEVKKFDDGTYLVTIDEASPGDCETFCDYIEKYLKVWGWNCKVKTEW